MNMLPRHTELISNINYRYMASIPKRMKMCISKNGGTFYIDYIVSLSGVRAIFRSSDLVVQSVQHHRQQVPAGSSTYFKVLLCAGGQDHFPRHPLPDAGLIIQVAQMFTR